MAKELKYLVVKKDLKFNRLKPEEKALLLQKFSAILQKPNGAYKEQTTEIDKTTQKRKSKNKDIYDCLINYCRNTNRNKRQFIFHGVLMQLSVKEYYMLCSLLLLNEIDEQDFNSIDFRPKRCNEKNKKAERNIEKSLSDLKMSIKTKIKEVCKTETTYFNAGIKREFSEKIFNEAFKNLAYIDKTGHWAKTKTLYKEGAYPFY